MKIGDVVRLRGGGRQTGKVISILPGAWGDGKEPMALVQWDGRQGFINVRYKSRHRVSMLEVVAAIAFRAGRDFEKGAGGE